MRFGWRRAIAAAAAMTLATAIGMGGVSYSDTLLPAHGGQAMASTKPMMVEDVFKNVQALKGLGVDDFLLTMGIMSAALGSDCVGCHPSAGTDHVDWALDTPRKRTARRMVQMVTAINRDTFNGRQVVTCWTCHRGRDRPVTTPTLDVVYGPPADDSDDVLTQARGVPSVDQVLDKYLQAIGGGRNVARVTSFVATGTSVDDRGPGRDGPSGERPERHAGDVVSRRCVRPAGANGASWPLTDRPRADAGGLLRLPRCRRNQVSVPLDIRLAGRARQLRVQRCEGECPDRRGQIWRTEC